MSVICTKIENDIRKACQSQDVEGFREAFLTLQSKSSVLPFATVPMSLYILCCEEAIKFKVWDIAEVCLSCLRAQEEVTELLECRRLFCESKLRYNLHDHRASQSSDWIQHRHLCAASVVEGIKLALRQSPCETRLVLEGVGLLWTIVEPMYYSRNFPSVIDVISFIRLLYDRLGLDAAYTRVQWCIRYATCLRGMGLAQEALPFVNEAVELSSKLHPNRLQLQLQRFLSLTLAERELCNSKNNRGDNSSAGNITYKGLYQYTIHLTQLVMGGHIEMNASIYMELVNLYERIVALQKKKMPGPFVELSTATSSMPKSNSHSKASKSAKGQQQQPQPTENDITDKQVQQEVLSELIFCLILYSRNIYENGWNSRINKTLEELSRSACAHVQVFVTLVQVIGLNSQNSQLILTTRLTPETYFFERSAQYELLKCIRMVEKTLTITHRIHDDADRLYVLSVVCFVLWKLCLPLLQTDANTQVVSTLQNIVKAFEGYQHSFAPSYMVYVLYECSLAELNDNSLSLAGVHAEMAFILNQRQSYYRSNFRTTGASSHSMEFAIMWLRHCIDVAHHKPLSEVATSLGDEDQVLLAIMQARRAQKSLRRVQFLKDAYAKLTTLEMITGSVGLETESMTTESLVSLTPPHTVHKGMAAKGKNRRLSLSSKITPVPASECPPRRSLVELYIAFLHECRRDMLPCLIPMMKAAAGSMCAKQIRPDGSYPELLYLHAQAHFIYAEIPSFEAEEGPANPQSAIRECAEFLVQATVLDGACVTQGTSTGWVTVSCCEFFLRQYSSHLLLNKGGYSVHHYLHQLFCNYSRLNSLVISSNSSLTVNLAFVYILSLTREYIESKGEVKEELSVTSVEAYMSGLFCYPKTDGNHPLLKRAFEVCQDVAQRVKQPSLKIHLCMLVPCLSRLLGITLKSDPTASAQEQLVLLLGRVSGPIPSEEKVLLLKKEIMELLALDPSVQLCGRVAMIAFDLNQDRIVSEVCKLANALYASGQLGWGRLISRSNPSSLNTIATSSNESSIFNSITPPNEPVTLSSQGMDSDPTPFSPLTGFVAPNSKDWMWYAKLLYCQAHIYHKRTLQTSARIQKSLYESILSFCTNCSIAVSYAFKAPRQARSLLVERSLFLYYHALANVKEGTTQYNGKILAPSLKIMLSKNILRHIFEVRERSSTSFDDRTSFTRDQTPQIDQILYHMSECLFYYCATTLDRVAEVVKTLSYLRSKLPPSLQKHLCLLEIVYTMRTGGGSEKAVSQVLSCDSATRALASMALARSVQNIETFDRIRPLISSSDAWENALKEAEKSKQLKAQCLLEMAQSFLSSGRISVERAKAMLLTGLSLVETKVDSGNLTHLPLTVSQDIVTIQDFSLTLNDPYHLDLSLDLIKDETVGSKKGSSPFVDSPLRSTRSKKDSGHLASVFRARFLGIHILYALFVLAPYSFHDQSELSVKSTDTCHALRVRGFTKMSVALYLLKHVKLLWIYLFTALVRENGQQSWSAPATFSDWFHFHCDETLCEAARASPDLDFSLNTEIFQGIILDVADFFLTSEVPHFSLFFFQFIQFAAIMRYGAKSFRTVAVWRASASRLLEMALRCGVGTWERPESFVALPASPSLKHWYQIVKWVERKSEHGEDAESFGEDGVSSSLSMEPHVVEWITTKGSLQDVLLGEANVLCSLGRIREATVVADLILRHVEHSKDVNSMCRCWLIKCALLEVSGQWRNALSVLDNHEEKASKASTSIWITWQGERIRQLVCMAQDFSRTKMLFASLIRRADAFLCLPGIGEQIVCDLKRSLHRKLLENLVSVAFYRTLTTGRRKLAAELFDVAVSALRLSSELSDRVAVLAANVFKRREFGVLQRLHKMSECEIAELFQSLLDEARCGELLLKQVQGQLKELNVKQLYINDHQRLCPPHCVMESRLLTHLAINYADRVQLAEEVLLRYRRLTLDELALPRGEGRVDIEEAVMDYYRDPLADARERHYLVQEWQGSMKAPPLALVYAFEHFRIPLISDVVDFATRHKAHTTLRAARDVLPEGCLRYNDRIHFLILEWEWRHTLEMLLVQECTNLPGTSKSLLAEGPSMLRNILLDRWSAAPFSLILERHAQRHHSEGRTRKDEKMDSVFQPAMTQEMLFVIKLFTHIVQDAQYRFDFETMSNTFCFAALFYSLWGFSGKAAYAVELALAAKNAHSVLEYYNALMLNCDSKEAKLWNTLQRLLHTNDSFALYSQQYSEIRTELIENSSVLQQCMPVESALNLVLSDSTSTCDSAPSMAVDGVCLSLFLGNTDRGVNYAIPSELSLVFVVLRHADGNMDARLKYVNSSQLTKLADELKDVKESARRALTTLETKEAHSVGRDNSHVTYNILELLTRIEKVLLPLFEEFEPSLSTLCSKHSLYLCLDPIFQPFPLEHMGFFSKFPSIFRELNAWSVIRKVAQRPTKSVPNSALYVIDPFADHPSSITLFTNVEHSQVKAQADVLSSTQEKYPVQQSYLRYKLQTVGYNTLIFNGCGAFTSVFTPSVLATAQLSQMQSALIISDSVSTISQRREQRYRQSQEVMSSSGQFSGETEIWQVLLFLLASGVRFIATTWYPSTPYEHDVLCKRMTSALLAGRSPASENSGGGKTPKDPRREFRILCYGARSPSMRNK